MRIIILQEDFINEKVYLAAGSRINTGKSRANSLRYWQLTNISNISNRICNRISD
jgi:hypothetical protein